LATGTVLGVLLRSRLKTARAGALRVQVKAMLKQGWMAPGFTTKVAEAVRKWGVSADELTPLYQDFVLSRMQQPSWPENIVEQCTSLQKALGLTAMTVGRAHCTVARNVFALTEAEQLPADSVGRFLFLADRIQDGQAGTFLEEARRYERAALAKVFFISEMEVRARIARVAMPMYQALVERFVAGENVDLASERQRLGIEEDSLVQARVEFVPVLKKLFDKSFETGLQAALADHPLREIKVTEIERDGESVQVDFYVEAKSGSREALEKTISKLTNSTEALKRFNVTLPADGEEVLQIRSSSVEVEGWRSVHLAAFEAAATEGKDIDTLSAGMDMQEEDRAAVEFGCEARAAIADCVMDGTSLSQTANRLGLATESAGKLLKKIVAEAFATWCAELPSRSGGPDEGSAIALLVKRVLSAGRLLTAIGVSARGAFDAKARSVPICRRILAVAEEDGLKPADLEVVRWIASGSTDLEQAYSACDSTVKAKVRAVLENANEAGSFDEYIRKINYPADFLVEKARMEYALMLEKRLERDSTLPTDAESSDMAAKAAALTLTEMDVQVVHEAKFAAAYSEACNQALAAETNELMSGLGAVRVRLVISEEKASQLMQESIAVELKPAVDEILEGYKIASGVTTDDDKKPIGFQGGVDAAIDRILDVKKSFDDFTLVTTGLVNFSAAQPLYKYVMSKDMNRAVDFAPVLGINETLREQAHEEVAGVMLGKKAWEALKNDQPISAEVTAGIWEPLGLSHEWADKFITVQKNRFISTKFENLFVKGLLAHEVVEVRSLAEELGVKLSGLDGLPLPKRKRLFHIEAKQAVENKTDLGDLQEAAEIYGLDADEANAEVEAAVAAKEKNDRLLDSIGRR
jgi:hypothetical protein